MSNVKIVSAERAHQYFTYDAELGNLHIKARPRDEFGNAASYARHIASVGRVAGGVRTDGYRKVFIDGGYYPAHRIIWLMVTGELLVYPKAEIDHINGQRDDNRWANLRKVTKSENQRNARMKVTNTSGVSGVNWKKRGEAEGRWVARIWNGPRHVFLGSFKTLHEARIARKAAERVLGFTRCDEPPAAGRIKNPLTGRYEPKEG